MIRKYLTKECSMLTEHMFSWLTLVANTVLVFMLFQFSISEVSSTIFLGVFWVAIVVNLIIVQEMYFTRDRDSGTYSLILMSPYNNYRLLISLIFSQWVMISVPVSAFITGIGMLNSFELKIVIYMEIIGLLSLWNLIVIGWFVNVLSLNLNSRSKVLQVVIIVPMYIPTLIFGVSGSYDCVSGFVPLANISMLLAISISLGLVIPFAISYLLDEGVVHT